MSPPRRSPPRARLTATALLGALLAVGCGLGDEQGPWIGGEITMFRGFFERAGGEFFAAELVDGEEVETCIVEWESRFVSQPTDCDACEFAFELEYSEPEIVLDRSCESYDLDLPSIAGTRLSIGYGGGERLYLREGEAWIPRGEAEHHPDEGELSFAFSTNPADFEDEG